MNPPVIKDKKPEPDLATLVDATLLIERIITHIEASQNDRPDNLREQIYLAAAAAREIGPRLAAIAGIKFLPNP